MNFTLLSCLAKNMPEVIMKIFRFLLISMTLLGGITAYAGPGHDEIALLTYLRLKPGTEAKFMTAFNKIVKPTLAEPGNIAWYVQQSVGDPASIVFYTRWKNEEALQTHLKSRPLVDYISETAHYLEPGYPQFVRFHPIDQLRYDHSDEPGDCDHGQCP
jgi:quinol monooxygenase YgiN